MQHHNSVTTKTYTRTHTHTHKLFTYQTVCAISKQKITLLIEPATPQKSQTSQTSQKSQKSQKRFRALTCNFSTHCHQYSNCLCLLNTLCFTPNMKQVQTDA